MVINNLVPPQPYFSRLITSLTYRKVALFGGSDNSSRLEAAGNRVDVKLNYSPHPQSPTLNLILASIILRKKRNHRAKMRHRLGILAGFLKYPPEPYLPGVENE